MPKASGEHVTEWSSLREGIARVEDAVYLLTVATIGTAGGKPPKIQPAARPQTAIQRARGRRATIQHLSLVSRLLPKGGD